MLKRFGIAKRQHLAFCDSHFHNILGIFEGIVCKAEVKRKINVRSLQLGKAASEVADGNFSGKIVPGNCRSRVFFAVFAGRDAVEILECACEAFGACVAIVQGDFQNGLLCSSKIKRASCQLVNAGVFHGVSRMLPEDCIEVVKRKSCVGCNALQRQIVFGVLLNKIDGFVD